MFENVHVYEHPKHGIVTGSWVDPSVQEQVTRESWVKGPRISNLEEFLYDLAFDKKVGLVITRKVQGLWYVKFYFTVNGPKYLVESFSSDLQFYIDKKGQRLNF